ncbi:hypothetical protein J6590_075309 [Homalodisca vitripennis]|nr:hypothetical protein J6590_075309 [Homalodisca vitripennis]
MKLAAEIPGDLILGGLMMVHERNDSVTCGPIMPQGGIQALETMLYTLDVVNNMPDAPFTLGDHILDDCEKDTYRLEMAVEFINVECCDSLCEVKMPRRVSFKTKPKPKYRGNQFKSAEHNPKPRPIDKSATKSPSSSSKKLSRPISESVKYECKGKGNFIFDLDLLSDAIKSFTNASLAMA